MEKKYPHATKQKQISTDTEQISFDNEQIYTDTVQISSDSESPLIIKTHLAENDEKEQTCTEKRACMPSMAGTNRLAML